MPEQMIVPEYENDAQWLMHLESERLRIRREVLSGRVSPSRLQKLQAEVRDLAQQIRTVQQKMISQLSR
jgi:hypothetical protein